MSNNEVTQVRHQEPSLHRLLKEVLEAGPVQGSGQTFSPEELIDLIIGVLDGSGDIELSELTRTNGLRDRVSALMNLDRRPLVDWVLLCARGFIPGIDRRMIPIKDIPTWRFQEMMTRGESEQAMMVCTKVEPGWRGINSTRYIMRTLEMLG